MPAPKKIGPLSSENVAKLHDQLRGDEAARVTAVAEIKRNLPTFVESRFELTPQQRQNMRTIMRKEVADSVGAAVSAALEHGGDISLQHVPNKPPSLKVETLVTANWSVSISISISC